MFILTNHTFRKYNLKRYLQAYKNKYKLIAKLYSTDPEKNIKFMKNHYRIPRETPDTWIG